MTLEAISSRLQAAIPGCQAEIVINGSPSTQNSLLVDRQHGLEPAQNNEIFPNPLKVLQG